MNKLIKFLGSYIFLLVIWGVFLMSPILSLIRFELINGKFIGNFHIGGLTTILYYFPLIISLIALVALAMHFRDFISGKIIQKESRKPLILLTSVTFLFLLLAGRLLNLEDANYPNFIYGHYGITISQLKLMSFICSLEVLGFIAANIYLIRVGGSKLGTNNNSISLSERASFYIAILGLLSMLVLSSSTFFEWKNLMSDARSNYTGRIGNDYQYLKLISSNTPTDIKVVLPPQGDLWPAIGNQPVARYFLFPRTLISGELVNNQIFADSLAEVYFPEINSTNSRPNWPIVNTKNKTVIFDTITQIKYKDLKAMNTDTNKFYKIIF